jgi:hypothetical protein
VEPQVARAVPIPAAAAAAAVGLLNPAGLAAPALWSSATWWTDFLHFFHLFSLFSSL